MKTITYSFVLLSFALAMVLLSGQTASCNKASVLERVNDADAPSGDIKIDTVYQLPVKIVRSMENYQGGTFKVLARKDFISRFRCSVCHTDKPVRVKDGALFSHSDIRINHGRGGEQLSCIECHDRKDRDFLIDMEGKKIDFDHSYQLCGQCHFRQKRDWLGGAHGKRDTYWAGERVVQNCTSCHNPHSPAFTKKMPETYSLPLD